jgi:hypothetical protein
VVDVRGVPRFLATPVLQPSFRGLGALGLQRAAQVELPLAVPVQAATSRPVSGGRGGDVGDAEIDADEAVKTPSKRFLPGVNTRDSSLDPAELP